MLYAARFEKNRGWLPAPRISNFTGTGDSVSSPRIAFDGSGNAIAVWTQERSAADRLEVRTSTYSIARGWGVNETISPDIRGTGYRVEFAMSPAGDATALWWQFGNAGVESWSASRPASAGF